MAVESKDGSLPVRLLLERQKFRKTFRTLDEVEEFLQEEASYWSNITNALSTNSINRILATPYTTISKLAEQALSRFRGSRNETTAIHELAQLDEKHAIISAGLYGRQIAECASKRPMAVPGLILAIHATLNSHNHPPIANQNNPIALRDLASISAAIVELSEVKVSAKDQRSILDRLSAELQDGLAKNERERREFEAWKRQHTKLSEGELEKFKSDATGQLSEIVRVQRQ